MKQENVIKQFGNVYLSTQQVMKQDIHAQLAVTLAERKRVLPAWEKLVLQEPAYKDIHLQLAETIAQFKRERQGWGVITNQAA